MFDSAGVNTLGAIIIYKIKITVIRVLIINRNIKLTNINLKKNNKYSRLYTSCYAPTLHNNMNASNYTKERTNYIYIYTYIGMCKWYKSTKKKTTTETDTQHGLTSRHTVPKLLHGHMCSRIFPGTCARFCSDEHTWCHNIPVN